MVEGILLTIITAATPLLIAALGELVSERSGVLNLGVEGMMAMGAVAAFAVAFDTGSPACSDRPMWGGPAYRFRRSTCRCSPIFRFWEG